MNLLQQLVHAITNNHPQAAPQAQAMTAPAARFTPHALNTNELQYVAPMQQVGYTQAQQHQMIPVGQPIPKSFMDSYGPQTRALAQIYNQNPQDPRVAHLDPAMFGYAPDNTVQQRGFTTHQAMQIAQAPVPMPLISPSLQGGQYNPGLIPFQGSRGRGASLQMGAFHSPQQRNSTPQNPYQMY